MYLPFGEVASLTNWLKLETCKLDPPEVIYRSRMDWAVAVWLGLWRQPSTVATSACACGPWDVLSCSSMIAPAGITTNSFPVSTWNSLLHSSYSAQSATRNFHSYDFKIFKLIPGIELQRALLTPLSFNVMAASSNSSSSSSHLSNRSSSPAAPLDPILRNALRYSLSPREYDLLHKHFLSSRAVPRPIRGKAPPPRQYAKSVRSVDDYNASAVRVALRVWVGSYAALKAWDVLSARLWGSGKM